MSLILSLIQSAPFLIIPKRSRVVGDSDADITRASALDNIALNARTLAKWVGAWRAASSEVEGASTEAGAEAQAGKAWKPIDQLS